MRVEFPVKPKPLTKAQREELIDEYGRLQARVDAHKPFAERREVVRAQILAGYESAPPLQRYIEEGTGFTLTVSGCAMARKITSMAKLLKLVGVRLFLKFCTFPLAAIDQMVIPAEHHLFLTSGATGPRTLTVAAKAAQQKGVTA
jgi:hypothetical protein